MSTVTIRMDVNARRDGPQSAAQLLIDGWRVNTGPKPFVLSLDQELIDLPPSVDDPGAGQWRTFTPGIQIYTLELGGVPVMVTDKPPERRVLDDGMLEYTWRDVEVYL